MEVKPLVIEQSGFKLEQVDTSWDLYVSKTTKHKDGTTSSDWTIMAYGISMPQAIEMIISCRMAMRNYKENEGKPLSLLEFFEAYQKEREATIEKFGIKSINLSNGNS